MRALVVVAFLLVAGPAAAASRIWTIDPPPGWVEDHTLPNVKTWRRDLADKEGPALGIIETTHPGTRRADVDEIDAEYDERLPLNLLVDHVTALHAEGTELVAGFERHAEKHVMSVRRYLLDHGEIHVVHAVCDDDNVDDRPCRDALASLRLTIRGDAFIPRLITRGSPVKRLGLVLGGALALLALIAIARWLQKRNPTPNDVSPS
jgi:hypothetical protein